MALPPSVLKELKAVGIPAANVSVVVQEVGAASPHLAERASVQVNPASLMKLVTTYAALELLGPAYRWRTDAYVDGEHLVLRGQGDPKLDYENFWLLLRALRSRGLADIRGDLVLDRSWLGAVPNGRIDDDSFRPYNVPPDALLVNFKSVRFNFLPQYERNFVHVFAEPALPGLQILNELKIVERGCPEGRAFRDMIGASFQPRPPRAAFTGVYPASCGERDVNVALHEPEDYVGAMLRQLWAEMGGRWNGGVRNGIASPAARLLYTHESAPLAQVVRDINKFSNNVMARQLYLTIGAEAAGAPAVPEKSEAAIRAWLAVKKLRIPDLVLDNGSGLSRAERLSAGSLAAILLAAWRSPVMPEFVASLPIAAADGTMRKRLRSSPAAGQAHLKTGLLSDVRSIAGYVLDRHGKRYVVVMIVNHPRAPEALEALDALVAWVQDGPRGPARPTSRPPGASRPGP
ncbi:MAG TPA: D-alanyl-D-alanine carboxypeptidase/D-alanyl-D-alanine-endopeptidase [Burkholderiales bacterium]|nr:D-alanyl-D-alanine carboxypeptidase/D-alanyl-D-alanine-endopeptidase [Burkholderiales bacterium]